MSAPADPLLLAPSSILVVEDNQEMSVMLDSILKMDGHRVWVTHDGRAALESIASRRIDLVLLDVGLPDMDGLDVCRRIKGAFPQSFLPIILLTARARRDDKLAGWFSGADDYVVKPFDAEELLAKMRVLLRIKRAEDALLQRNRELDSFNAVAMLLDQSLVIEETMPRVLDEVLTATGLSHGAVFAWEAATRTAQLIAYQEPRAGGGGPSRARRRTAPPTQSLCWPRWRAAHRGCTAARRRWSGSHRWARPPCAGASSWPCAPGGPCAACSPWRDWGTRGTTRRQTRAGRARTTARRRTLRDRPRRCWRPWATNWGWLSRRARCSSANSDGGGTRTPWPLWDARRRPASTPTRCCSGSWRGRGTALAGGTCWWRWGVGGAGAWRWPIDGDGAARLREGVGAVLGHATAGPGGAAPYVARPEGESVGGALAAAAETALIVCPLPQAGRAVGVLVVFCPSAAAVVAPDELVLAGEVAQQAALAIENARLFQDERRMVRKLTELDALKSQFISMASHEFRTPLSVIKGFANLLKRREEFGFDRAAEAEYLDVIDLQIQNLTRLIDNMLSVSRIESGQLRVHAQAVDLSATIRRTVALMEVQAAPRAIALTLTGLEELSVQADPQHVEQVLLNLLSNAIKYSDDGTTVAVGAVRRATMALVTVADQGVGIEPDQMPRLFEKFARLDNRRAVEAGGTGLGLYIARSWVEANGGAMWADSTAGTGSTFSFTLAQ